jgi:hypothetical protein
VHRFVALCSYELCFVWPILDWFAARNPGKCIKSQQSTQLVAVNVVLGGPHSAPVTAASKWKSMPESEAVWQLPGGGTSCVLFF